MAHLRTRWDSKQESVACPNAVRKTKEEIKMQWLSGLIEAVDNAGLGQTIYDIFFAGGFIGLTTYNLTVCKHYGIAK